MFLEFSQTSTNLRTASGARLQHLGLALDLVYMYEEQKPWGADAALILRGVGKRGNKKLSDSSLPTTELWGVRG